jgi:hypothetical protein
MQWSNQTGQTKQYTENKRATDTQKHPGMIFGGEKRMSLNRI